MMIVRKESKEKYIMLSLLGSKKCVAATFVVQRHEVKYMNLALSLRWILQILFRDITIKVRIIDHTSMKVAINYGVPQGSTVRQFIILLLFVIPLDLFYFYIHIESSI